MISFHHPGNTHAIVDEHVLQVVRSDATRWRNEESVETIAFLATLLTPGSLRET